MLSWSSHLDGADVDLGAVARGRGDAGIASSAELLAFATAAATLRGDATALDDARRTLVARAGSAVMIDAAAVAANFHMMTRLADGTGARYPASRLTEMASTIALTGAGEMPSRR